MHVCYKNCVCTSAPPVLNVCECVLCMSVYTSLAKQKVLCMQIHTNMRVNAHEIVTSIHAYSDSGTHAPWFVSLQPRRTKAYWACIEGFHALLHTHIPQRAGPALCQTFERVPWLWLCRLLIHPPVFCV